MKKLIIIIYLCLSHKIIIAQKEITVTGNGKTCTDAKNDALRNAINNAYGSLIYSSTEITNEKLISDDINMLTSGNILKYLDIESCTEINNQWTIKLKVTVSQTELAKFIEGKGKSIAISGIMLKQKTEQEVSAKKSETKIIKNILSQLESLIANPFDYEISHGKVSIIDAKYCDLPIEINVKTNNNYYNSYLKLSTEMEKISINQTDQNFRSETLKDTNYSIEINSKLYFLRNKESIELLKSFYSKLLLKLDDYKVVDGCLKDINLKENNKITKLNENTLFFHNPGFISKTISANYLTTVEEIGSLDRINIFPSNKAIEYKKGKSLNSEYVFMKYSETNPLEFLELKNSLLKTLDDIAKEKEAGSINLKYNINFTKEGFNRSFSNNLSLLSKEYQLNIEKSFNQIKLNPSKLCGKFINTSDSISLNFKWKTYNSRFAFNKNDNSNYSQYFHNKNLPIGTYILTVKEKELNDSVFKDIFLSEYTTRGPLTSLYSIALPGWGTRRVTYNEKKGWGRFWLVAVPLAISITSKVISNNNYDTYLKQTNQGAIDEYYSKANDWNKSATIFGAISAAFYVYDIVWVFGKGLKNLSQRNKIKEKIKKSEFQIQFQTLK